MEANNVLCMKVVHLIGHLLKITLYPYIAVQRLMEILSLSLSPVLCVFIVPTAVLPLMLLVRGEVTPTCAVMPLRQEPVCEMAGILRPEPPLSDSSETSEGFRRHLEPASIFTPLSEPPSERRTSSLERAEEECVWRSTAECFSASVWG